MTKIKCYNCGEMGHFAQNCPKPRENANLAQEMIPEVPTCCLPTI